VSLVNSIGESTTGRPVEKDNFDAYEYSWLVYRCVKIISQNVANLNFHLYRLKGEKVIEIDNSPILDLLAKPNPMMSGFDFLEATQTYLELSGNAYWLKVRGKNDNKIQQLWPLRPDWVEVKLNDTGQVSKYVYRVGAGTQDFDAKDVIHFKETNPRSSVYGLSVIKPALDIISNLVYATRWNKNFFYNNARPDFWIISKAKIGKEEKEELKKKMQDEYGGVKNAHKFGFLEGDATIVEMNKTMRDMEFTQLTASMIEQILGAFGVGKAIIGMQGMNRAEAEAQIYTFLSLTVEPRIRKLADKMNEFLISEYGDDLYLDYEDPTPEDRDKVLLEYESGIKNNWLAINEIRDREGLPAVKGGWDIYMPFSMMPLGSAGTPEPKKIGSINEKEYRKLKEDKWQSVMKKKILAGKQTFKSEIKLKKELTAIITDQLIKIKSLKDRKDEIWKEHDKLLKNDELLFKAFIVKLLRGQEKRVKEAVEANLQKDIFDIMDWDNEKDLFVKLSLPLFTDIVTRRGERASSLIGMTFQVNPKVLEFINDKSFRFADQVNDTTKDALRETLKEGYEAGEGIPDLTKRVGEIFDSREKWEAERIARTETIEAHNQADLLAYEQSGVVSKKEWLAEPDACELCQIDGESVLLKENFSTGDDSPPAHPNCRCTILPVLEEF